MSESGGQGCEKSDRLQKLQEWVELQRTVLPIESAIDQVRSRCQDASGDDRAALEPELYALLVEAGHHGEALHLLDAAIAERPDDVLSPFGWGYDDHLEDPDEKLKLIDFVLARARSTGRWVRYILGSKAWVLVYCRRGEALGRVSS